MLSTCQSFCIDKLPPGPKSFWFKSLAVICILSAVSTAAVKKPVNTVDDLPRHTYDIKGDALQLLNNKPAIIALSDKVKADCEDDLAKYDIKDRSMLAAYQQLLQSIDLLNGRYDEALTRVAALRELQNRESDKLLSGTGITALIFAIKSSTGGDGTLDNAKYANAFKQKLRELLKPLPMDVIHDELQQRRSAFRMISAELVTASVSQQLNPMIQANPGAVPGEVANALITTRFALDTGLTVAKLTGEVYGEFLDAKSSVSATAAAEKSDLWTPTLATLDKNAPATPVVVGIWDTGVDTRLFPNQLWTNPDGEEPDQRAFGDVSHGIAFDMQHHPVSGDLYPLDALKTDKAKCMQFVAASTDMQAGIETPEVQAFRDYVLSLHGNQIRDFTEDMGMIGNYAHGTHVAGIVAAGNPFVRLLKIRETFPYKEIPDAAPSIEEYTNWGESAQYAIDFAKRAHARVINMSWRIPRAAVEGELAIKGVGKTTAERAELSRQIFNAFKVRLESAITGAPDILFVAGAGNEDNDADFSEYIPAGIRRPNLLTVGAVDASGKPTTFTTTGKNIELYANGYQIDSLVPGGEHMKFSGTSMASPQVANLAAKLIALNPQLSVAETIQLIRKGSTPMVDHPGRFIINPKASIALLSIQK